MCFYDDTNVGTQACNMRRGDMYIVFDVEFPKTLGGPEKRQQLVEALSCNN